MNIKLLRHAVESHGDEAKNTPRETINDRVLMDGGSKYPAFHTGYHSIKTLIVRRVYAGDESLHHAVVNTELLMLSRLLRGKSHPEILIWFRVSMGTRHLGEEHQPCHRTLYRKSTITSFSMIPMLLKCFRTVFAS